MSNSVPHEHLRFLASLQLQAKNINDRMNRSQVNMLLLFLLTTLGIANVVSHIDRSFQPRTAAANESEALTGSPRLSRARRVAIYNGQGVVKVCYLR